MGAVGLDGEVAVGLLEGSHEGGIDLQGGFAASEHDEAAGCIGGDGAYDVGCTHLGIGIVAGVAEGATEVASTEANKDSGAASVPSFALEGIEDFVDAVHAADGILLFNVSL